MIIKFFKSLFKKKEPQSKHGCSDEIFRKWTEALRSGDYKQGHGYLRMKDKYCCLGVLCDVYAKETGKGKWEERFDKTFDFVHTETGDKNYGVLPEFVRRWAGLWSGTGTIRKTNTKSLAILNDSRRMSFEEIADIIEAKEKYLKT
jgi:hypothetical protein